MPLGGRDLHELEPGFEVAAGGLDRKRVLAKVTAQLERHRGVVAELARDLVGRIGNLTVDINELERRLRELMAELSPRLLNLEGCAALSAAKAVGETADVSRFRSSSAYAMNNGSAPIPVSSGNRQRFRLNPGGNRQLNAALHRIAVTQLRGNGAGRAYFERRLAAGATRREAMRSLRRRISDEVYRRLKQDFLERATCVSAEAA